ncbi:MauE/DoxX family redox-associated membrane protein [Lacipirellula parvula]|uniref:Methylamine utilisation protein MauE domain-containing protein n=1 Tax=Lacipirellula parvula TaxID=2650471 RepID=A0A5K7XE39_9BACT|nr:hypothetical protein PLANPX_3894 [Lacipirellula parvula]
MPKVDATNDDPPLQRRSVFFVRLLLTGLLLTTAALKVLSPAESAAMAIAYNIPPFLTAMVVQAELALAALLLFGCRPRQTLFAAAVMFALFGAFSSYRGWAGYESCGCFGSFQVNPWITAALDGAMFLLAAWGAWKSPVDQHHELKRFYYAGGLYAVAGLWAAAGMISSASSSHEDATIGDTSGLVVLEPGTWIGKPFPLMSHLSPVVPLHEGRWTILIHHHDCPRCQEAVPQYERLAEAGNDRRIALVETPPYGEIALSEQGALRTRLSEDHEWFVQTPVEIQIDAGVVVGASLDLPAIAAEPLLVSQRGSGSESSSSLSTD